MTSAIPPLNAFLDHGREPVAHAPTGPLADLTLAVKDIFDVEGQRTGGGSPARLAEARPAARTAPVVQALLDAGARFAGRTQTDELTFSLMGQNAHYSFPVNPAAPGRVTGGSSSGSAAAVAGGLADIALGSDTGGSIRGPASFCGLVGLRITHGAIPLAGAMPLAPSLDTAGWFARDVETYAKVAEVLLGGGGAAPRSLGPELAPHPHGSAFAPHPYPLPVKDGERGSQTSKPPSPRPSRGEGEGEGQAPNREHPSQFRLLRLAALDQLLLGPAEAAEYGRMSGRVADRLGPVRDAPALSHAIDDLYWAFRKIQAFEAWGVHGAWISADDRRLGPGVRERFAFGRTIDAAAARAETRRRDAFRAELADLLGDDGVLVLPTMPGAAPLKDMAFDDLQSYRERALRLLCLSGLSGLPQITLPLGKVDGAPFAISLLGPAGSDLMLIGLAKRMMGGGG